LAETAEREQRRRRNSDAGVGRQQADRDGRYAHREQGRDERRLAADAIAEMAEQRRANGAREERERERREGLQGCRGRVARRKEQLREDEHGSRAVDVEVEELYRRADEACDENAALRHVCDALAVTFTDVDFAIAAGCGQTASRLLMVPGTILEWRRSID